MSTHPTPNEAPWPDELTLAVAREKLKDVFAHTPEKGKPVEQGQPLVDHLINVGKEAATFADAFGMASTARLLGLTHDLGKASDEFQAYLRRGVRGGGPGHSDPGAAACVGLLQELMPVVQGHHGGLPNEGDSRRREGEANEGHVKAARDAALSLKLDHLDAFETLLEGRELEPLLRMLLSCLVDADRLDSEAFDKGGPRMASYPCLTEYRALLSKHLDGLDGEGKVNEVRRSVQADCRAKAALPPGFFRLTVPTGGGKTLASLLFALEHARAHGHRRVVVAVPYTTVVEQTAGEYAKVFKSLGEGSVLEHHAAYNEEAEPDEKAPNAEGLLRRRWATENWDHPLIVTTNVQLMDSLLSRRTSKVRKIHRLAKSVIILDEAQTLPADLLQAHFGVLGWLVRHAGATVVLCTATQPDFAVIPEAPTELQQAEEIVEGPGRHFDALRRVRFDMIGLRTHEEVAAELAGVDQGLVIVNSRHDSVEIFRALRDDPYALYLSTYLCPIHRRERVKEIRRRLKAGEPCRVVSTQVVEAGIDVSFPNLWRARGPLEAIVQAAGRCNRNDEMRPERGHVRIFDLVDGRMPKGDYQARTEAASKWLDGDLEALASPEVQTAYFRRLLTPGTGSLGTDRIREQRKLQEQRERLDYPFTEKHGRMIEDEGVAVITAKWRMEKTDPLLEAARFAPGALRKLAPYTVSLPESFVSGLRKKGNIETHESGALLYVGVYDEKLGVGGDGTLSPELLTLAA